VPLLGEVLDHVRRELRRTANAFSSNVRGIDYEDFHLRPNLTMRYGPLIS
jgi:hypothetical protein